MWDKESRERRKTFIRGVVENDDVHVDDDGEADDKRDMMHAN